MPHTHSSSFRVRFYECDAYGHLNNAGYLRFFQEAAFNASADAGYDQARYEAMGFQWLIRNSEIEYLQPVFYGETVEVKTWVADFRKVSSRRAYEMTRAGVVVARGYSDWAFLDAHSVRPAAIPAELHTAFFPEGLPEAFPRREPFETAPAAPSGVFCSQRRVAWRDVDPMQHVNNAVYLEYIEDCGFQAVAAFGWPVQRMSAEGFGILIRRHQIEYVQAAKLDDPLELATWASQARRSTAVRHYTITRAGDGALLARVHSLGVWVDLKTGRPIRIPPGFLADFSENIV